MSRSTSFPLALPVFAALVFSAAGAVGVDSPVTAVEEWLKAGRDEKALAASELASAALTKEQAATVKKALIAKRQERIRASAEEPGRITAEGVTMRYEEVKFDDGPDGTPRSLFLSMHGGGGAPAQLNDSQWRNQVALAKGYRPRHAVYIAPRAPSNDWDLWHKPHIDPLFDALIERAIVRHGVDPNRVYLMGYSAGGDGVYQLAPRMADRFAAAAMMAGHPNETQPLGLRNVPFTIHVGGLDAAYNRNKVAATWGAKLQELRAADPGGYESWTRIHERRPHWMNLEDKEAVPWMQKFARNPLPDRVVWLQDDVTHDRFYWLAVPPGEARKGDLITATRAGQKITLTTNRPMRVLVRLNDAMLDLDRPVQIERDGKTTEVKPQRKVGFVAKTLAERGDPHLVFCSEVEVP